MKSNFSAILVLPLLTFALTSCSSPGRQQTFASSEPANRLLQPLRISSPDIDAAEPAVAAGPNGSIYIAWVEHLANKEANVMFQQFDSNGVSNAGPTRVNPQAGMATAWRGDPPTIAVGQDGTIFVCWTARVKAENGHASDIYLSTSRNGGTGFDPPVKVNDDKQSGPHGMHSLAVDKSGRVYIAWLDERNVKHSAMNDDEPKANRAHGVRFMMAHGVKDHSKHKEQKEANREIFFAVSSDGGKTFSPNKRLASEVCPCCKTTLLTAHGRVYVSWRQGLKDDFRHIAVIASGDGGETFSKAVIVSDDKWQLEGCPVSGASLASAPRNAIRIFWYAEGAAGPTGLYWSESEDGGETFSPRQTVSEGSSRGTPLLNLDDKGNYRLSWESVVDGKSVVMTARAEMEEMIAASPKQIVEGELPATAFAGDKFFVSFIKKEGDKRSVWLKAAQD